MDNFKISEEMILEQMLEFLDYKHDLFDYSIFKSNDIKIEIDDFKEINENTIIVHGFLEFENKDIDKEYNLWFEMWLNKETKEQFLIELKYDDVPVENLWAFLYLDLWVQYRKTK